MMLTAAQFVERMNALQDPVELEKIQSYFKSGVGEYGEGDRFMGVRMGHVFQLAKEFIALPPAEIEKLMESPVNEIRSGAMSVMAKQAGHKKTTDDRRKELYELYAGTSDRPRMLAFLDQHAASMPRTTLTYAMEHLDKELRAHYRAL